MDVYVMGKKWMWKFAYAGGGPNAIGTLHVPAEPARAPADDQPRRAALVLRARLPHQAGRRCPGRYTETWFEATKPGRYQILCAEYCGTWHSQMWGEVVVMPGADFDTWMAEQKAGLAERVDTGGDDGGSMRGRSSSTARRSR
jgi:cytochrome c oxidase subunit 2